MIIGLLMGKKQSKDIKTKQTNFGLFYVKRLKQERNKILSMLIMIRNLIVNSN